MAIDVLEYAGLLAQYNTEKINLDASTTNLSLAQKNNQAMSKRLMQRLHNEPWDCTTWAAIPTLPSVTGTVCVYDASGYYRCGASCAWTVPAGATYARFQMWGAGAAASSAPQCCGISVWGGSGAYASVILPVTPGQIYCACAGCALCCNKNVSSNYSIGAGCASFVVGPNLTNVCADGGEPSPYCWLTRVRGEAEGGIGYCVIANASTIVGGSSPYGYNWCMCGQGGFCNYACQDADAIIPFSTSCKIYYGCVGNATAACHCVVGAPGMFNSNGSTSYQTYMCLYHPPVINQTSCCCYMCTSASATCNGCLKNACTGVFQVFGRGGSPSSNSGGTTTSYGGQGTSGFVKIEYL